VRALRRDDNNIVCAAPDACGPLDSSGTACTAGGAHLPPRQRTVVRVDEGGDPLP